MAVSADPESIAKPIRKQDPSKPTLAIRLIALALITLGTLSITEILVQLVLSQGIFLDMGVFQVPIGIGLLRQSRRARWWASLFACFACVAFSIGLAANIYFLFFEQPDSVTLDLDIVSCVVGLLVLGTVWNVLSSKKTIAWFELKPNASEMRAKNRGAWFQSSSSVREKRKPFQFRLSTLLFCTTLLALVCAVHRSDFIHHPRDIGTSLVSATEGGFEYISYGVRRSRHDETRGIVDFVVIETTSTGNSFSPRVSSSYSSRGRQATLKVPEGRSISLPGESQLYEIKEGVFRAVPGSVSVRQLDAFLDKPGDDFSIEALLAKPKL